MAENIVYSTVTTDGLMQFLPVNDANALAEHSFYWLKATIEHLIESQQAVRWHCLFSSDGKNILISLPLITHKRFGVVTYQTVSSFYSSSISSLVFTEGDTEELLPFLLNKIKNTRECDQLRLGPVTQKDALYNAVISSAPLHTFFAQFDNWYTTQLTSVEKYLYARPSQLKNTVKRRIKKLDKEYQWSIEYATDVDSFQQLFNDYKSIYQSSWKGEEFSYVFIETVCFSALERNQLRLAVLYIDAKPAAAQIWFVANKRASIFKLAYDPYYQPLSVGSILTMDLFKTVIEKDSVVEVEYGTGNEAYKKDWVEQLRQRVIIDIYNEKTLRGKLLFLVKRLKQKLFNK